MMKKTIYLLLLVSIAIAGCVATREVSIPLTSAPKISFDYIFSLDSLPELPRDLSHIEYIDMPTPTWHTKDGSMSYLGIDIDTSEVIQLERIPHIELCLISDIQEDKGLLFVTFTPNRHDTNGSRYPKMYAIYTRQGKLVAQLGEPIADIIEEKDGDTSHHFEKDPDNDIQYNYSSRLQIDRKNKEVYFNTERNIIVYFDYNGHYKRTEIATVFRTVHHTTRGQKVFLGSTSLCANMCEGLLCGKDGVPYALAFKNEKKHDSRNVKIGMTSDDLMVYAPNSDTIWQILPTKKIARYVYTGYAKVPEGAEEINGAESHKHLWRNSLEKREMITSDKYIFTTYHGPLTPDGSLPIVYQLYDRESGHAVCGSLTKKHQRFYLDLPIQTCLSDGNIVYVDYPMSLKRMHAKYLETKDSSFHTYTAQEEQFIRNLKLDGGPVLFFVKLKKF